MQKIISVFLITTLWAACSKFSAQQTSVIPNINKALPDTSIWIPDFVDEAPATTTKPDTTVGLPTNLFPPELPIEKVSGTETPNTAPIDTVTPPLFPIIQSGADRMSQYLPLLKYKRVALVVNQTSVVKTTHLADTLLSLDINIRKVFAPEHGFRGDADAGATIVNAKDAKTGLPIISLYGKNKKPTNTDLQDVDVVVFDIQDVGARFYTYISTMHYVMEACAEQNKELIVLDRPNPNGFYVDGPILEPEFTSFVGMHPIPVVHGLTIGELAIMINQEGWLANSIQCNLTIIPCLGYNHRYFYELPVKPSPNLPNIRSVYLYPYLCFFEGTNVSVGRGTDKQFQVLGSPKYKTGFTFTPKSKPGATKPMFENQACYGFDLSEIPLDTLRNLRRLDLSWLIRLYQVYPDKTQFFNSFFNNLAGNATLQQQIKAGLSESAIENSWQKSLTQYKLKRKKYLLYEDFE